MESEKNFFRSFFFGFVSDIVNRLNTLNFFRSQLNGERITLYERWEWMLNAMTETKERKTNFFDMKKKVSKTSNSNTFRFLLVSLFLSRAHTETETMSTCCSLAFAANMRYRAILRDVINNNNS